MDKRELLLNIAKGKTKQHAIIVFKTDEQGNKVEIKRTSIDMNCDLLINLVGGKDVPPVGDDEY